MELKVLETKVNKDFNNAISLMGIIPLLAFLYLLVVKIASLEILIGDIGYTMLTIMAVVLTGILAGRQILKRLIEELFNYNRKIVQMQQELIEKNRLAVITETVLALGHEINNPLLAIQGNIELLNVDLTEANIPVKDKERILTIQDNCERIRQVTEKLSNLSKPATSTIFGGAKMIDLNKSS